MPQQRLVAAPRDVTVPVVDAWRVPAAGLAAWCVRCHDHARTAARQARQAALRAELLGDLALFDAPTGPTPSTGSAGSVLEVSGGAR